MFGGDDEDGDFLSPTGGAKLASLFGLDQAVSQGNESFQYTAPKQPKKSSNAAPLTQKPLLPPGAPTVLFATAVQAFRYINGQYVKQGKLGAAVLGNHATKEYKLLLYMSQQKQVTGARIHIGFVLTVQPNNYCTFYDDQRQNWSLMFEMEKSAADFCKEVCLAKANSVPGLDATVSQDISLGEGQSVENGDSLEVAYTGWLLQNNAIGQVFDSNVNKDRLLRMKLGAGKVIKGWEEGMVGMKKAGRRLMVIPPALAYGSKGMANRIPANSTLIFEAELKRVRFSKDSGSDQASGGSRDISAAPSPAPSTENLAPEITAQASTSGPGRPVEPAPRIKSNSLSEQLANPDVTKAKLISRMAKMGQPMLPFLTGVAGQPESSDSELEDTSASRTKERHTTSSPVQISAAAPGSAQAQPSAMIPAMTAIAPQHPGIPTTSHAFRPYSYTAPTSMVSSQLQPVSHVYPAQTVPYVSSGDVTSFLMTEARQHSTEIRLAVGKVGDKVDQLVSKMDDLQRQGNLSMGLSGISMETSMIMHGIQRTFQENDCLKKEVFEKSSRIEEQNRKIGELINQNQRCMEQSNLLLEQRNDSLKSTSEQSHTRLLQAEQDKGVLALTALSSQHALPQDLGLGQVCLSEQLAASTARVSQLQLEATSHQQRASELEGKLTTALHDNGGYITCIAALEAHLEELKEVAESAQTQHRTEKQRGKDMEQSISNMEEELQDLRTDKGSLERMLSDRKRKWQAERQSRDEEMEELRRSSQQELDTLRTQLRKARSSNGNATSEQLSQLQAELEEEWKERCERTVASAREQHRNSLAEVTEHRDALEQKVAQLQEELTVLKQSRASEEQQAPETKLLVLQGRYAALQKQSVAAREELEGRVAEAEAKLAEQLPVDTAGEVKRVMNGVFHSLRGQFDLAELYSGQAVLGVIVSTIKSVTLELLSATKMDEADMEEEEEEERSEERNPQVNGEREEGGDEGGDAEKHGAEEPNRELHGTEEQVNLVPGAKLEPAEEEQHGRVSFSSEEQAKPKLEREPAAADDQPSLQQGEHNDVHQEAVDTELRESGWEAPSESSDCDSPAAAEEPPEDGSKMGGPPAEPPPPPPQKCPQGSTGEATSSLTPAEGSGEQNREEPFLRSTTAADPSQPPPTEEEEDELSLKGRPPPAPLFGEDEDEEEDLGWLS